MHYVKIITILLLLKKLSMQFRVKVI